MKLASWFSGRRSMLAVSLLAASAAAIWGGSTAPARADVSRVLPDGQVPQDRRLQEQKDLNGYFPFVVPDSAEAWQQRAAELRRRVMVATGTWPLPERTPLNPVIHSRLSRDGFTVEKVYFESVPNHFVTGLLFRPPGDAAAKSRPAVLCPHGHGGRLQDYGAAQMKALIESGAEKFEQGNRFPKLSRCAQLARMGCVVFIYDMLGYADSVQISSQLAHRFAKQRPDFEGRDSWGLFSTQAELRLQSIMGLQSWNSIRALDFLADLPDVDPGRIAVTGGSGGGTQTILLCAVDPRPVAAFPQGMVSTSMQGGCTCENCCLLRVGTGNVELCALFAPKPQGMTTANDWTKEMMTKGFPELKQLYTMLGAADHVMCQPLNQFPHNYNYVTRHLMYEWFNKHLQLGQQQPIAERDWELLSPAELSVWDEAHPRPAEGSPVYERALTKWLAEQSDRQIGQLVPTNEASLARYREVVGGAIETMIGRRLPPAGAIEREKIAKEERGGFLYFKDILRHPKHGEVLPVISFYPQDTPWNNHVVIWLDGRGKRGVFDTDEQPKAAVRRLLAAGASVVSADLLYQGEFLAAGQTFEATPVVKNPREFAGFTFGYNDTVFARRVHDVLSLVSWIRHEERAPQHVHLVGVNGAGPIVAAARALAGKAVDRAAVDTAGFRFGDLRSYRDPNFIPGAVKYGDLPAMLALSAPHQLLIAGEQGETPAVVAAAYQAAGRPGNVKSVKGSPSDNAMQAANWLLE